MSDLLNRIKTALEFLKDGESFKVDGLYLGMKSHSDMYVTGWSTYQMTKYLTKQFAITELNDIKYHFFEMVEASGELKFFIQGKNIEFNLVLNDAKARFGICTEKNGALEWFVDIRD